MHKNIFKMIFSSHKVDRKATQVVSEKRENEKGESMEEQEKVVETKETEKEPVVEEKKEDVVEEKKEETPVENDKKEETNDNEQEKVEEQPNQVADTEPQGNGIRIEDLVTKDILAERLSALESKLEAIINENKGLQDKLTQMTDKYEKQDFGGMQKQGVSEKDKIANDSFDEYSKQFM